MKGRWLSFPKRGNPGKLDLPELMVSRDKEVTKEVPVCKEEEESREGLDHLDSTGGNLADTGSQGLPAPQVPQAHLG